MRVGGIAAMGRKSSIQMLVRKKHKHIIYKNPVQTHEVYTGLESVDAVILLFLGDRIP